MPAKVDSPASPKAGSYDREFDPAPGQSFGTGRASVSGSAARSQVGPMVAIVIGMAGLAALAGWFGR